MSYQTEYDFAAIQNADEFVPRCLVMIYLDQLYMMVRMR
jgi:hypothetical protein